MLIGRILVLKELKIKCELVLRGLEDKVIHAMYWRLENLEGKSLY